MSAQRHRRHRRDKRTGLLRLQAPNGQLDLSEGKRLSQVVGRAEPDGLGGGGWRPAATRDNDPNAGVRRLRRSQYIQSIGAWHQDVCHDEPVAIGLALKGADRRVAVWRGGDRELELLEEVHQCKGPSDRTWFYRLNVIRITLPPLRDRTDDIPLLARHFVDKACRRNSLPKRALGEAALRALVRYDWPGNVRELENAVEHAVALCATDTEIQPAQLPSDVIEAKASLMLPSMAIPEDGINLNAVLSKIEHELINRCLERTGGNKRQAARLLHLSRTTLIDKLNRLGREVEAVERDQNVA